MKINLEKSSSQSRWRIFLLVVLILLLIGLYFAVVSAKEDATLQRPLACDVYYSLYATQEAKAILVSFAFLVWTYFFFRRANKKKGDVNDIFLFNFLKKAGAVWVVALLTGIFCVFGALFVFETYPLAMDEYIETYQAEIFAHGKAGAPVPTEQLAVVKALTPRFVVYNPALQLWFADDLPVYAFIRFCFLECGAEWLTNAVLSVLTLFVLAAIVRELWPGDKIQETIGVILLAVSSQFLLNGMTAYSMPANLLANLLWLWFYLRKENGGWLALPWIGAVALGIHQPLQHAFFVLPFLASALFAREWKWLLYWALVYGTGCGAWICWRTTCLFSGVSSTAAFSIFSTPDFHEAILQLMNLNLVMTWQTPALIVLFLIGLDVVAEKKSSEFFKEEWFRYKVGRNLAAGVILTFCFYVLFPICQGHGWGYRYIHGVLGNLVLVSLFGWERLRKEIAVVFAWRWLAASLAVSLLIQIPFRIYEAHIFVAPFARVNRYIHSLDADYVVIDYYAAWYGWDLVRNDPFLPRKPLVLLKQFLDPEQLPSFQQDKRIHFIANEELVKLGMHSLASPDDLP